MAEASRTIAYICPKCRQPVVFDVTVFSLCAGAKALPCPCGKSQLEIEPDGETFQLSVPCVSCGKDHRVTVGRRPFLFQKAISLSCGSTGLDCCYIGEEDAVYAAMKRLDEAVDELGDEKEERGTFLNPIVMTEVTEELKEIAARGGVSCTCGSKKWSIRFRYAAIELVCADCGRKLRIPAAAQSDIEDICCRNTLIIGGEQK